MTFIVSGTRNKSSPVPKIKAASVCLTPIANVPKAQIVTV